MAGDPRIQVVPKGYLAGDLGGAPVFERLSERLDELGNSVKLIADRLRPTLGGLLDEPPHGGWLLGEVSMQFTIEFEAEAGVIIARASTAAGFEVSLAWKRTQPEASE